MRNPVTRKHADHSTPEDFTFTFFCDRCGSEWRSPRYAFNPGDFAESLDPAVFQMLWNDQHAAAFARANLDAAFAFNRCPVCRRSVCGACFHLSEIGVSDICEDCLKENDNQS